MSTYNENLLDQGLQCVWDAEKVGGKAKNPSGVVVQADCYLLGAMIQITQQSFLKGGWNLRSAYNYYISVQKSLATYEGADRAELECSCNFGLGLFNLIVSMLPPIVVKVVEWIGFSGDRHLGLNMLRAAVRADANMSAFAAIMLLSYLAGISTHIGDLNEDYLLECKTLLDWAEERFPRSIIFSFVKARYLRSKGLLQEAIAISQQAVDDSVEMPTLKMFSYWQQCWCSFVLLDLEASTRYSTLLLAEDTAGAKNSVQAAYAYHLGITWAILAELIPADAQARGAEDADDGSTIVAGVAMEPTRLRAQRVAQMKCFLEKTPTLIDPKRAVRASVSVVSGSLCLCLSMRRCIR
jgi:hypothetical protein